LKAKHSEEFMRNTKLKKDSNGKKKAESSFSNSPELRQVPLQESAEFFKIWNIIMICSLRKYMARWVK